VPRPKTYPSHIFRENSSTRSSVILQIESLTLILFRGGR